MKNITLSKRFLSILILITFLFLHQFCKKKNDNTVTPPTGNTPVAAFISSLTNAVEGDVIQFTDESTNTPTTWLWNFGDGNTSTLNNPSHTYAAKGLYTVSLAATNNFGTDSEVKDNFIKIITEEEVGVSEAFIDLVESNGTVDDYNNDVGTVTLSFTGEVPEVSVGSVLTVDLDTMGYLRKVVSSQLNGNTLTIETEPAFLTDVFVDKDFNLDTELIEPNTLLTTSSKSREISNALTDGEGYIHPVEIIYHKKNGETTIKSALNLKSGNNKDDNTIIDFTQILSKTDIYGASGEDVHLFIDEGHISLASDAVFEFDFDFDGELTQDTRVRKGDLTSFKFYLESDAEFQVKLALDLKKSEEKEDKHTLYDMEKVTAKFVVGTVPVWITFECDVFGKYKLNGDAALHADWGFESEMFLKSGGTYNKNTDSFTPIQEYTPVNTMYPLKLNGEVKLTARYEIYPRIDVKFYSFFGPNAELATYMEGKYNSAFQTEITTNGSEPFLAWNSSINLGLEFRLGSELTFLWGLYNKEFGPITYPCFEDALWEAPFEIELLTENVPTEAVTETKIPLSFKVTDMLGNGVPLCPITIKGDGSVDNGIVATNTEGVVQFDWTLPSTAKANKLTATIYKSDKTEVDKEDVNVASVIEEKFATVTTADVSEITENTAVTGGEVTDDGNVTVTARGVCWSTTQNPTIDESKTTNGTGEGVFVSNITELNDNTTYYVRAYASNSEGTAYGKQKQFTTEKHIELPTVTTADITEITQTTASSGGGIADDGNVTITARGVCWSLSENPTIEDDKTSDGSGIGTFTSNIESLVANTSYYVRAYATSDDGTAYGDQKQFTTVDDGSGDFTDARDGNNYNTIVIGDQTWMAENLAYLPAVSSPGTNSYTEPYYYVSGYFGTDTNQAKTNPNYATYGVLYNWIAAMDGASSSSSNPSGVEGVCPSGWHLPSSDEWLTLINYLGGADVAGGKMKETGTTHWKSPNTNASNSSGFTALPGGGTHSTNIFLSLTEKGHFWSSTENTYFAKWQGVYYQSGLTNSGLTNKNYGLSVRCVKD